MSASETLLNSPSVCWKENRSLMGYEQSNIILKYVRNATKNTRHS